MSHKFLEIKRCLKKNALQKVLTNVLHTGRSVALVPHTVEIKGRKNTLTNAVALSKHNNSRNIYYTSSSTNFDLTDAVYEALTKGSGRLYKYDIEKNTSEGELFI